MRKGDIKNKDFINHTAVTSTVIISEKESLQSLIIIANTAGPHINTLGSIDATAFQS